MRPPGRPFFAVPTATFRVLSCFIVLRHARRRVVHVHMTATPTAPWTAQQVVEAFPFDEAPRYLIQDRDGIYGGEFRRRLKNLGIKEVINAPQAPSQNPYCERVIGSIRRECLDHVIVLNEQHLQRILADYFEYYPQSRTHLSLDRNSPVPRQVEPPLKGQAMSMPQVSGLHHGYTRTACTVSPLA